MTRKKPKRKRAPAKSKLKYDCMACGALFATPTEHMSHYTTQHDAHRARVPGQSGRGTLFRTAFCFRCASEIRRDAAGRYKCACGFTLPERR